MVAQETARAAPTAVEAGALSVQDEETMAAIMATQEAARADPAAVEAGELSVQDEEMMAAIMATQEVARADPQWRLGRSLYEMRRRWRPLWWPRRQPERP
jgi:hypothetical protein